MMSKILLGIGSAIGLYWILKTKKTFPTVIGLGMIAGILLVLFPSKIVQTLGLYIYMGFVALAFIYGLIAKEKKTGTRITMCLMSASIFTYWLWVTCHWHGNTLLLSIFALLVVMVSVISKVRLKDELGIIILLTLDAAAILFESWMKIY